MEGKQNIYYALGILAFAIAKSDGKIQPEEKEKLFEIVNKEMGHDIDFEYAEIIFQLLERDNPGFDKTYRWAIEELDKGRHYLSPEIKQKMVDTIEQIAISFNKLSSQEEDIIKRLTMMSRERRDVAHVLLDLRSKLGMTVPKVVAGSRTVPGYLRVKLPLLRLIFSLRRYPWTRRFMFVLFVYWLGWIRRPFRRLIRLVCANNRNYLHER